MRKLLHGFLLLLFYTALRLLVMEWSMSNNNNNNNNNDDENASTTSTTTLLALAQTNNTTATTHFCETLTQTSALQLWVQQIDRIITASRLPADNKNFLMRNKVTELLRLITPRLGLGQSVQTRQWKTLERLLHKLQSNQTVIIVVVGGSVTMGVNCFTVKAQLHKCAWPYRLEQFLLRLQQQQQQQINVQVHNYAIAGSNTATGTALLPLLPVTPDIIINAYSTNDMHIQTVLQAASLNLTLREQVFDMSQTFVRAALNTCTPAPPLLIWLDDYLGNEQPVIQDTMQLSQSIHVLAQYYGFSFVSYAAVGRDWVYGDTREALLSPGRWYATPNAVKMQREIHPSQSMHMITAWLLAYHFLLLTIQTCTLREWHVGDYERTLHYDPPPPGFPFQLLDTDTFPRWPRIPLPVPTGLPPELTPNLTLEQVSDLWKQQSTDAVSKCQTTTTKCPFVWVSGLQLHNQQQQQQQQSTTTSHRNHIQDIQSLFDLYLQPPIQWTFRDDHTKRGDKWGWMPQGVGARMMLQFPDWNNNATAVTFFYLASHGTKWMNSTALVTLESTTPQTTTTTFELHGYHDKKTSEMYIHSVSLPAPLGRITLELVKGTTFQLMGLSICGKHT